MPASCSVVNKGKRFVVVWLRSGRWPWVVTCLRGRQRDKRRLMHGKKRHPERCAFNDRELVNKRGHLSCGHASKTFFDVFVDMAEDGSTIEQLMKRKIWLVPV